MNRRWSMPADPQEALLGRDVRNDERLAGLGDEPGHALAERHPRPADLEAVEAVRRRQRQVGSVPIEQVQRGDVRVECVAGPVDDGLEQLVPRSRGRREARDLVEEAELLELVRLRRSRLGLAFRCRHRGHDTSVRAGSAAEGCGSGQARMRNGDGGTARGRGAAA